MPDPKFVEWTSKTPKEYPCKNGCGVKIQYAKFFGSDGKLLTTDGEKPYFDNTKTPMSNTGWPTNPNTKQMHKCNETKLMPDEEEIIDRSQLDTTPQAKELDFNDLGMESLKKETLQECAILWKEEEWITNYLKIKSGGESPHPSRVGLWHKLISERLRFTHESD